LKLLSKDADLRLSTSVKGIDFMGSSSALATDMGEKRSAVAVATAAMRLMFLILFRPFSFMFSF
jgi:hypothetical protein